MQENVLAALGAVQRGDVSQLCKDNTIDLTFSASKFKGRKQMLSYFGRGLVSRKNQIMIGDRHEAK